RFFLFCSRDVWFVVALPVYLQVQLDWSFVQVSGLMACWVIFYGMVQAIAPRITGETKAQYPGRVTLVKWGALLSFLPALMALLLYAGMDPTLTLVLGLLVYGGCFAVNSSVHSYLIVAYAQRQAVSLDVGFYYMANAGGRLLGTLLSGLLFQVSGLLSCLLISSVLILFSTLVAQSIPEPE
ncbi:MAG: MFS transporter, partial [Gammaproteobacteria bacterium]|nr:MFS transporter [Gammaproteobacteria bacterium]